MTWLTEKRSRWRSFVGPGATVLVLLVALWLVQSLMAQYHYHEIRDRLRSIPAARLCEALALTVLNYVILVGYDWLALRSIGREPPLVRVALVSFTSFVASLNFGAIFGGAPLRARLYSQSNLTAVEIAEVVLKIGMAFWLGVFAIAGVSLIFDPVIGLNNVSVALLRAIGLVLLSCVVVWLVLATFLRTPISWRGWQFTLPSLRTALAQLVVAVVDLSIAAACLYVLLPLEAQVGFLHFAGIYCVAVVAVLVTHVPGGIGVFEAVMLSLVPADRVHMLAALLAFRVIYYLIPLGVAGLLAAGNEALMHRSVFKVAWRRTGYILGPVSPTVLAGLATLCGTILLLSGSTPGLHRRLTLLDAWLPLGVVETAHFLNSLVGLGLLLVAPGLQRRLDSAWWLAMGLLWVGVFCSLLKGADYEEASLLGSALLSMWACKRRFYRHGSFVHEPLTPEWLGLIALVVICSVWLGLFAYRHVEYSPELWWTVELHGDAPRFLRASVGVVVAMIVLATSRLLIPHRPDLPEPNDTDLADALAIISQQSVTWPNLIMLGDKTLLFNAARTTCLSYSVQGSTWVVMGDPIGPVAERAELVWEFRALCDRYSGRPVFYQVHPDNLTIYLDQGFSLLKLGEEARVRLSAFTLEGPANKAMRQTISRMEREQCRFELIPPGDVPNVLNELRRISDDWLNDKQAAEKGFSMGFFDEQYLSRFPVAVVRRGETIVAFANVWCTADHREVSPDLMRYSSVAPKGVMEYLFIELMRWGQGEGYTWFNLGMAPLSGIEDRPLAPLWNKAAGLVYRHGQHFYRFEGLRKYKEKFHPDWTPKYLAFYGGLELPRVAADVTALIGRKRPSECWAPVAAS